MNQTPTTPPESPLASAERSGAWYETEDGEQVVLPVADYPLYEDARRRMLAQLGEEMAAEYDLLDVPRKVKVHDHEDTEETPDGECKFGCDDTVEVQAWLALAR